MKTLLRACQILIIAASAAICSAATDWPQFRGPLGTGFSADAQLPDAWSPTTNLAWKTRVPGTGWSQPIIVRNTVYVTSAVSDRPRRPLDYASGTSDAHTLSGSKAAPPAIHVEWKLWALDLSTGSITWEHVLASGPPKHPIHPSNTYASETPAADGERVYVLFGSAGIVAALDPAGTLLWHRELGVFTQQENYGTGSSLRCHNGLLFIQLFNEERAVVLCFDGRNGSEQWHLSRPSPGSCWNTPLIWHARTGPQLIVYAQKLMTGHDPQSGRQLWQFEGDMPSMTSISADPDRVFFGCRDPYKGGPLRALAMIPRLQRDSPNGAGPLVSEVWSAPGSAPGMSSPLVTGPFVYSVNHTFLTCHDADTGKQHSKERLPGFRSVIASPIATQDKILFLDESGAAMVLKAGRKFEITGQSNLPDIFWASPAASGDTLVLRGVEYVYGIRAATVF